MLTGCRGPSRAPRMSMYPTTCGCDHTWVRVRFRIRVRDRVRVSVRVRVWVQVRVRVRVRVRVWVSDHTVQRLEESLAKEDVAPHPAMRRPEAKKRAVRSADGPTAPPRDVPSPPLLSDRSAALARDEEAGSTHRLHSATWLGLGLGLG